MNPIVIRIHFSPFSIILIYLFLQLISSFLIHELDPPCHMSNKVNRLFQVTNRIVFSLPNLSSYKQTFVHFFPVVIIWERLHRYCCSICKIAFTLCGDVLRVRCNDDLLIYHFGEFIGKGIGFIFVTPPEPYEVTLKNHIT